MDMPAILQQSTMSELELAPSDSNESFNFEHEMSELYQIFYPKATDPRPHPSQIPYSAPLFQNNPPAPVPPPKEPPSDELCRQLEQRQRLALLQSLQAQHQFQLRRQQHYCGQQQQQQSQRKSGGIRKKRKAEQLKTVYRVPAANILNVDKWAWRKYGQKPIKGSPFPRNYYRCSSSKGCTARKQVERSLTEAEVYVVTYTGDHLHPWPLHRNALAGISRPNHRINSRHAAADSQSPSVAEEGLLIPNKKYVDEDMLRGMEELARQIQHGPGSPV